MYGGRPVSHHCELDGQRHLVLERVDIDAFRFIAGRAAPEPSQSLRPGRGAANIMEAPAPSKGVANPQNDVEAMTARSVPISQIENYIDTLPLGDEELSALWLLAWSQTTSPAMG